MNTGHGIRSENINSHKQHVKLALEFSTAMLQLVALLGGGAGALWFFSEQHYPQLLALICAVGLMAAGSAVYRIMLNLNHALLGMNLLLAFMLLSAFLIPVIAPVLLPMAAAAILLLSFAGQALLGKQRGFVFMSACMLVLVIDSVFAQDLSSILFAVETNREFASSGIVIVGNLPPILGFILIGRQIVMGYETALAEEHAMVRMLIDNLPDSVYIKDSNSRIVIDNTAHARILGNTTPDQVVGKTDFDFFPPELAQKYYDDEQQIIQTGQSKINIEEPTIDSEGNQRWLLTTKAFLRDNEDAVVGIVGISRDITTLKEAELERDRLLEVEQAQRASLEILIDQVRNAAKQVNGAAAEILAAATQQAGSMVEQEASITQTMATVEEVRATVTQTAERAQSVADAARQSVNVSHTGQEAVAHTIEGMSVIKQRVADIAENILMLAERTQQIGEIIDAVNALSDQSKLLALNASIEAARAGEEGKGFAVVAMEVRQLAEQSRQATARVRDILSEIQSATNTAVMVTEEGSKGAESGMGLVDRAGGAIHDLAITIEDAAQAAMQIAASTHQQTNGMEQLTLAMSQIRLAATQTAASSQQMERSVQDLLALAQQLEQAAEQQAVRRAEPVS